MQSETINQWLKSRMYMLLLHFKSACVILSPTNVRDYADIYDLLHLPKHSTTAMAYTYNIFHSFHRIQFNNLDER